ncbi:hypothetical protein ACLE20_01850 [Rhizobium sp. YIM 134829]|uniref:hypothetical protein n=1 Tax=Rhizobium sp. YIM 134829 TaxID=3390453 RepID=UPI00397AF459
MQRVSRIVGIICLVLGLLWALQGLGLVGGSFMTGQSRWLVIGSVVALVGLGLLGFSFSKRR